MRTLWPATSISQMLPSGSTRMPWEDFTGTSFQAWSILPFLSNSTTGWEPRLNTQTLSDLSTATPEHSPEIEAVRKFGPVLDWMIGQVRAHSGRDGSGRGAENEQSR